MIIYQVTNLINNKKYIGQTTKELRHRWNQHCNTNHCPLLAKAINKYGRYNFKIEVIDSASNIDELNILEEKHIAEIDTLNPKGYNLLSGGLNHLIHQSTKDKISKAKKGIRTIPDHLRRKPRTIKIRDHVYIKLRELGNGSYAKGIELLVYQNTNLSNKK